MKGGRLTIVDALRDRNLFGALPEFRDLAPWSNWLTVLKATHGLPLSPSELSVFRHLTGRAAYAPPAQGWGTVAMCVGRRAGKSAAAILLTVWAALTAARGEWAVLVAQDQRAGQRLLFSGVRRVFNDVPLLRGTVQRETAEALEIDAGNGTVHVGVFPCKPAALRGYAARIVVLDEIAFASSPDGREIDRELVQAARPTLATTGGKLVMLSSQAAARGVLFDAMRDSWGSHEAETLALRAASPDLNPTIDRSWLDTFRREDPAAYRVEIEAQFSESASALFDAGALSSCVVAGRGELSPLRGVAHRAFVDPAAGGRGGDRYALAIGHRDGGRVVLDALRAWSSPFSAAAVVAEAAALCKRYGVREVTGDRFGGAIQADLWGPHGIRYRPSARTASDLFLDAVSVVSSGGLELPDPATSDRASELLEELRAIERKPGGAGRDRAEAPRGAGRPGHADLANAVAGLVSILPAAKPRPRLVAPIGVERSAGPPFGRFYEPAGSLFAGIFGHEA